jgi:hypothetical protein
MATFTTAIPPKTIIAAAGPFTVAMEHDDLVVVSIPTESVPTFAWWIIREYCLDRQRRTCFHSILLVRTLEPVFLDHFFILTIY